MAPLFYALLKDESNNERRIMIYEIDNELKKLKKAAGLTDRDLANEIKRPPAAVSRMINGFQMMGGLERLKLVEFCKQVIAEKGVANERK